MPKLREGGVQIGVPALVLPSEVVAFPDVGPAVAAGILACAAFEAVAVADRVCFHRRRFAEQRTKIVEVRLRRGTFL